MTFVAYYRVSTQKQGLSGLGIEAQKAMVTTYLKECEPVANFTDIESGKNDERPELKKAMELCQREAATLVIAKLDRLSRDVHFISGLQKAGIDFVCCDMPDANKFTLHIFAALAEQERDMISQRTKAALTELKKKGVKLGKPENLTTEAINKGRIIRVENAQHHEANRKASLLIAALRKEGKTFAEIAAILNNADFKTRRGKKFKAMTVKRLWDRTK